MPLKQSIILKGVNGYASARGVAVFEDNGREKYLSLSLAGLTEDTDRYVVYYNWQKKTVKFPLSDRKDKKFPLPNDTENGGAVLLSVLNENCETGVLYGKFSSSAASAEEILPTHPVYDDEVVATENYYDFEKNNDEKSEVDKYGQDDFGIENAVRTGEDSKEDKERKIRLDDEEDFILHGKTQTSYYEKNKGEIDKLFKNYQEEKTLSLVVPYSKWVKIPYGKDKYYVVGIINENQKPRYICYGVPGKYGEKPKEIKNYCSFIPASLFKLKGAGYWVMYQDALSGICIAE